MFFVSFEKSVYSYNVEKLTITFVKTIDFGNVNFAVADRTDEILTCMHTFGNYCRVDKITRANTTCYTTLYFRQFGLGIHSNNKLIQNTKVSYSIKMKRYL